MKVGVADERRGDSHALPQSVRPKRGPRNIIGEARSQSGRNFENLSSRLGKIRTKMAFSRQRGLIQHPDRTPLGPWRLGRYLDKWPSWSRTLWRRDLRKVAGSNLTGCNQHTEICVFSTCFCSNLEPEGEKIEKSPKIRIFLATSVGRTKVVFWWEAGQNPDKNPPKTVQTKVGFHDLASPMIFRGPPKR
jgi:hypothetical protein